MNWLRTFWVRFLALFRKQRLDAEMDKEMRSHIELQTQENIAAGMHPQEARCSALRQFGWAESIKETCRDQRGFAWLDNLSRDFRVGVRMLAKNPAFTSLAVLTLTLGTGVNTAIFSVINQVLLKPLPYPDAGQLVVVWEKPPEQSEAYVAGGVFLDWRDHNTTFEGLSLIEARTFKNFVANGGPERIRGWSASADLLSTLAVQPILGRGFLPGEDQAGRDNKVVLLGYSLWKRRFGGDTNAVGSNILLDGDRYAVIGVLPPWATPDLRGSMSPNCDFLIPLVLGGERWQRERLGQSFNVIGRLKKEVSVAQAQNDLSGIQERLKSEYPKEKAHWSSRIVLMSEQISGQVRPTLLLLFGAAGCVLLIACANVSSLVLARALSRQREIAVRMALGASRWHILRQLLTEGLLLAFASAGGGLLLAFWCLKGLSHYAEFALPTSHGIRLDASVLAFCLLISLGSGIMFGLVPARQSFSSDLKVIKNSHHRLRSGLVASQVALAVVLLMGSGLLLKSLYRLLNAPVGFVPQHTLGMDITLSKAKYPDGQSRSRFISQVFERLGALPGVAAVGSVTTLPMTGGSLAGSVTVEGRAGQPEFGYGCGFDMVGGSYFRAMGIPILSGRDFSEHDADPKAARVCIVNDVLSKLLFPAGDALGKRIRWDGVTWEIVGLARSIRHYTLDQERPDERLYLPQTSPNPGASLILRTTGDPLTLIRSVRDAILALDAEQPVSNVRTMERAIENSTEGRRFTLLLLGLFAGLALLLSAIGIYGIMAYTVTRRTNEIGIRMALGAQRPHLLWLVLRYGLKLSFVGISLGLAGALALTRAIRSMLFEVETTDPTTLVAVIGFLVVIALIACSVPAHRATRVDPMTALRHE